MENTQEIVEAVGTLLTVIFTVVIGSVGFGIFMSLVKSVKDSKPWDGPDYHPEDKD